MKEKAVIYARVSSREQEETGYSLPSQEKLLNEYAQRKNFEVLKVFSVAESASGVKQRKVFNEMIEFANKNKIPNLLCEKVDRLTRNLKEALVANDWVDADANRQIHFVKQGLVIHKNAKSDDKFRWDFEIVLAKKYIANLSEEVRKGQKEKISQGWIPKSSPLGYKTVGEKGHKIHVIDEEKAPYIREMFELYASGNYSTTELCKIMVLKGLRNKSGKKVSKSRVYDYLADPFYCGDIVWNGKVSGGKQTPIITRELYNAVKLKLNRKLKVPRFRKHNPVFKSKIFCKDCDGTVTWEIQKGHWYGHCTHYRTCSQKVWIRQKDAESDLFLEFDNVAPKNTRVLKWLEEALKEGHAEEINDYRAKREEINRMIALADKRIEKAYIDKLDGIMPSSVCLKVISDTQAEKSALEESLKTLSSGRQKYYEAGYAIHELASKAKEIYSSPKATIEDKRMLLSYIFSNMSLEGRKTKGNFTFAFEFLSKWVPRLNSNSEPYKYGSAKALLSPFGPLYPTMLRMLNEVRTCLR